MNERFRQKAFYVIPYFSAIFFHAYGFFSFPRCASSPPNVQDNVSAAQACDPENAGVKHGHQNSYFLLLTKAGVFPQVSFAQ